jgi:hypothetical protein
MSTEKVPPGQVATHLHVKDQVGLRVLDLHVMNVSLLGKWLWKLENSSDMWQEILRRKYMKSKPLSSQISKIQRDS